ncbi:MAG: DNA-binding response regulator [Hyphomicrobiales bacterium]|nr:DNA-binding response regulator [Hyphomicrobiales bacterium]
MTEIRIVVVNDYPLFRAGIVHILSAELDFAIVGEGESADDACRLARLQKPHIVVLDATLPGDGIKALSRLIESDPALKVIMLTNAADDHRVGPAMQVGAWGYLLNGISGAELTSTVRMIHRGQRYVAPAIAAHLFSKPPAASKLDDNCFSGLSSREEQILHLLVEGLSNKEIGGRLRISEKTVKHYLTIILEKLNAKNRVQAALMAYGHLKFRETRAT